MKRLYIIAALLLGFAVAAGAAGASTFELRVIVDCKPESAPLPYEHQGAVENLCLSGDLILDRSDIVDFQETLTSFGTPALRITVGQDAVARLTAATTAHVGGRIAIVFGGKIVSAVAVWEPITGNQLEINFGVGDNSLEALVAGLRGGKP